MTEPILPEPPPEDEDESAWIEPVLPRLDGNLVLTAEAQRHNHADLIGLYYHGTEAPVAVTLFEAIAAGKRPLQLKRILRDHREESITDADEMDWREAFDHLLSFYSVLELALQVGYIDAVAPAMARQALRILDDPWVRDYYERHYPLFLPQLLRQRLAGGRFYRAHRGPRQVAALQRAIELEHRLLRHPEVQVFLALADDFYLDGYGRADLLDAVENPQKLMTLLTGRGRTRSLLGEAMGGLRRFLFLCDGLHRVLQSVEGDPVFQSGIWHLFGYWFAERREEVVPCLRELLEQIDRWPALSVKGAALPASRRSSELRASIDALASGRYGEALREGWERGSG
jgi:hypothetical protein